MDMIGNGTPDAIEAMKPVSSMLMSANEGPPYASNRMKAVARRHSWEQMLILATILVIWKVLVKNAEHTLAFSGFFASLGAVDLSAMSIYQFLCNPPTDRTMIPRDQTIKIR
jgi:hypothetical protein